MRAHMVAPQKISPKGLSDYLEVMSKAAFQAGISWQVVEKNGRALRQPSIISTRR